MVIKGVKGNYEVDPDAVGKTPIYNLYLCVEVRTRRRCLLQIAIDVAGNSVLDRMALFLQQLAAKAAQLEEAYIPLRQSENDRLNYQFGFPELVDSFICTEQGRRRVNILVFPRINDVSTVIPLSNVIEKNGLRVDLQTSAWVMRKLLKLLDFAHGQGFLIGRLDAANILIDDRRHYLLIFDWTEMQVHPHGVPNDLARQEIQMAAQTVTALLGGSHTRRFIPRSGNDENLAHYTLYTDRLFQLAAGSTASATDAHAAFYDLVHNQLGWTGFHRFVSFDL